MARPTAERVNSGHLGALLLVATLIRLPGLTAPFVFVNDWGFAQFLVYARNYRDLGPMLEWTIPCFGEVDGRGIVYANHPWLASVLLGIWGLFFNYSEAASRSLGLVFSLISIYAMAQLGEKLGGARCGMMAATLFAFSPLGIHLGKAYCMEPVHIAFLLLAYIKFLQWRAGGSGYRACLVYLALAQLSDIYALFFCPWLFFLWLRDRTRPAPAPASDARWWGLMLTPVAVQAVLMAIMMARSLGRHAWERGVSRTGRPWHDWVDPAYWTDFGSKLLMNYGYTLPVLALLGLLTYRAWPPREREGWVPEVAFWWFYATLYTLLGTTWMKHHLYLVVFWGPALTLQTSLLLNRLQPRFGWTVVALNSALSLWLTSLFYLSPVPLQIRELGVAQELRQTVRSNDIVIGLPPHIAYYVDHKASVPYDFFLRRELSEPAQLNEVIRELVGEGKYQRVLVCPRFIQYPAELKSQDLKNLYPADAPYQAVRQEDHLLIWEQKSNGGPR